MLSRLSGLAEKIGADKFFGTENLNYNSQKLRTDFYTIAHLFPYLNYDPRHKIFLNENSLSFLLEVSPIGGLEDSEIDSLSNLFSDLEEEITVQVIQYASPMIKPILDNWYKQRNNKSEIFTALAKNRTEFLKHSNTQHLFSEPFVNRDFRIFIAVSYPFNKEANYDKLVAKYSTLTSKLTDIRNSFESQIKSMGSSCLIMNADSLIELVSEILNYGLNDKNITAKSKHNGINPISREIANGAQSIEVFDNYLLLNNQIKAQTLTVKKYPAKWSQNMNNNLIGDFFKSSKKIGCPFIASYSFKIVSQENAKAKAAFKMVRAVKLAESPLAKFMPSAKSKAIDAIFLCDKLEEGNKLIESIHHICFFCHKNQQSQGFEQAIKNIYAENGFELVVEEQTQLLNFLASFPMLP